MKKPTDQLNRDSEAEFSDVTDQLQLPALRLRNERRAVVLAAFEQARTIAHSHVERNRWSWGVALAAAAVITALVCSALFVPHRGGNDRSTGTTALAAADHPSAEHPALCELNITLAMANARTAAAERELAWLTAMQSDTDSVKEPIPPTLQPASQNQP